MRPIRAAAIAGDKFIRMRHDVGMQRTIITLAACLALAGQASVVAAAQTIVDDGTTKVIVTDPRLLRSAASFEQLPIKAALAEQTARIEAAVAALPAHPPGTEMTVLAVGGSGFQAIFDREARRAAAVLVARGGGPALTISNTPAQVTGGILSSPTTVALSLAALGRRARPGDTLVVYLASHGGRNANIAMAAPRLDFDDLTASALARALDRAGFSRRIVIVSACFGATWIKPLASPTTIVIAAAAADRTSFGCDDRRELTVFGEAILRELARPDQSLAVAFARAKRTVSAVERAEGDFPSHPQAFIGSAMTAVWTAPPSQ